MTEVESNLLNEINKFHCELYYDQQSFTDEDLIVKLNDVIDFYNFLDACRNLLLPESSSNTLFRKCGFMRINNDNNSIVPYVVKNKRKYLPIFYFDGETKSLEEKAITLENFDLAYLKFCCKMHGIKTDLFSGDKCLVTSLEQIKSYFTEDTIFEDFWPTQRLRPTPPVQENGNHSRGQAAAGTAVAVPSARRSVSSKKNRWDSPVRFDNNQKTNSFAATTNAYRTSLGSNSTMTNFTATTFSSPYPPTQSMKQSHSTQRKESIPPENVNIALIFVFIFLIALILNFSLRFTEK